MSILTTAEYHDDSAAGTAGAAPPKGYRLALLCGVALFCAVNIAADVPARLARGEHAQRAHQIVDALRQPLLAAEHAEFSDHPLYRPDLPLAVLKEPVAEVQRLIGLYLEIASYNPQVLEQVQHFAAVVSEWVSAEHQERQPAVMGWGREAGHAGSGLYQAEDTHRLLHALEALGAGEQIIYRDIAQGHAAVRLLQWSGGALIAYLLLLVVLAQYARQRKLLNSYRAAEQARRGLAESEARLAEAQHVARLGSWELDLRSMALRWSPEIYCIFEVDPDDFPASYQAFLDLVHPDDRQRVQQAYSRSVQERAPYDVEHRLLFPDGRVKHVLEHGKTDYADDGRPTRSVGTMQDITERVQAQAALAKANSEWALAMDFFEDAIHLVDLDDRVVRANRAFCRFAGVSEQAVVGEDIVSLVHPHGEQLPCPVCEARRARRDALLILEPDHPSNPVGRPIEVTVRVIRDGDGEPLSILTAIHDLSQQRKIQDELRLHRDNLEQRVAERTLELQRQAQIIDQIHDAVVSTDLTGVISGWNKGAERLFGYPAQEAVGRHISFVYPQEEHEFLQHQVIAPLKACGRHETEVRMRRKDGSDFFALLSLSMLRDADGAPTGMIGYSMDITARKRAEAALHEQKDALVQANRELEAFSYSVSHDLRAPLRAIDGFSQALLEDYEQQLDEVGRDYLGRVRKAAQRMAELIDELLGLARLGRREFHSAPVDLSALATVAWQKLAEADPDRSVEVVIEPGLSARGDGRLLAILFDNLFGNAWKYTGQASQPYVEFGRTAQDGQRVYYIRDNGVGFDMRYADRLFGPFQRLHGGEFEGNGIGLATVQRIVQRHGGRVWAEAQPGEGATFFFTLSG